MLSCERHQEQGTSTGFSFEGDMVVRTRKQAAESCVPALP